MTDRRVSRRGDLRGSWAAAVFRRGDRNAVAKVPAEPANTPAQVLLDWSEECGITVSESDSLSLLRCLRGSRLLFDDDGSLVGSMIVAALREQGAKNWPDRNKLRMLANSVHEVLAEMGLL